MIQFLQACYKRLGWIYTAALLASLLALFYWSIWASNRYVSQAQIVVQRADLAGGSQQIDFASVLNGVVGANATDQLLLRAYLLSVDMLKKLDAELDLRSHYSDPSHDLLSRMWFHDAPIEWFHRYYLSRVSVDFDSTANTLIISAQAYDPRTAQAITRLLVQEGQRYMNEMAHRLALEQVRFLEKEVESLSQRLMKARRAVLEFQDKHGMLSPLGTMASLESVVNNLEAQLVELKTRRHAMIAYLTPNSPDIVKLDQQIRAIENQLRRQRQRLATPKGESLNKLAEQFRRLQMQAEFAESIYKTALASLEQGRIEAARTLKVVSILQSPILPEYPLQPRRIYNITVFTVVALLLAGVLQLIVVIVRDHQD